MPKFTGNGMAVSGYFRNKCIKFFALERVTVFETVRFLVAKEAKQTKEKADTVRPFISFVEVWLRSVD